MKRTVSALMAVCVAFVASAGAEEAPEDRAAAAQALYRQGLLATREGDSDLARQSFMEALRVYPQHINARIQLDRLRDRKGEMAALKRKNKLKSFIIPTVDYEEVGISEALQALSTVVEKQSDGEFSPNFVVRDRTGAFASRPVTLQLRNVPATVVLKHLLELADARVTFSAHVIAITPRNVRAEEGKGDDPGF